MSSTAPSITAFFRSELENKRFGDQTLRILESALVARDVTSLLEARSALREVLMSEVVKVMREIKGRGTKEKLEVAEFFVKAFALVGDVELYHFKSCLALKYESLILRELKNISDPTLQVSTEEWASFAEDSLKYGFYSIAIKGIDNALLCIESTSGIPKLEFSFRKEQILKKIKQLKDMALALIATHSVQVQTAEYLKKKSSLQELKQNSPLSVRHKFASSKFKNGIKKRNMHNLHKSQSLAAGYLPTIQFIFDRQVDTPWLFHDGLHVRSLKDTDM